MEAFTREATFFACVKRVRFQWGVKTVIQSELMV